MFGALGADALCDVAALVSDRPVDLDGYAQGSRIRTPRQIKHCSASQVVRINGCCCPWVLPRVSWSLPRCAIARTAVRGCCGCCCRCSGAARYTPRHRGVAKATGTSGATTLSKYRSAATQRTSSQWPSRVASIRPAAILRTNLVQTPQQSGSLLAEVTPSTSCSACPLGCEPRCTRLRANTQCAASTPDARAPWTPDCTGSGAPSPCASGFTHRLRSRSAVRSLGSTRSRQPLSRRPGRASPT